MYKENALQKSFLHTLLNTMNAHSSLHFHSRQAPIAARRAFRRWGLYLGLATLLTGWTSTGQSAVIYRNNFGNRGASYIRYGTVSWKVLVSTNDSSNVVIRTTQADSSIGLSDATGAPTNVSNVNAGTSQSDSQGFGVLRSGQRMLTYTDSYSIDRATNQIESIQWTAAQYKANGTTRTATARVALQIAGQWYVSQTFSLLADHTIPIMAGSTVAQQEAEFANYAGLYSLNFSSATWYTLTATPGSLFQVGASSISLPGEESITAIGLYLGAPGSGAVFFDSFTVNATVVPEAKVNALLGMGLVALLLGKFKSPAVMK